MVELADLIVATSLSMDGRSLALELYELLRSLDKRGWMTASADARARLEEIQQRASAMGAESAERVISQRWLDIVQGIHESMPADDAGKEAWKAFRARMIPAYEALAAALRVEEAPVPSLRPKNLRRSAFHVTSAVCVLLLIEEVLPLRALIIVPAAFAGFFWFLEILRRFSDRANDAMMWVFKHVAHPHERHRVNSSTWYGTALLIISLIQVPMVCAVGVAVLGLADPAAGLVGRRYGRVRLVNGRTLEGTLAFFGTGVLATLAVLSIWHVDVSFSARLAIGAAAAAVGALAELFTKQLDDNFTVPVASAFAAWGAAVLLGAL